MYTRTIALFLTAVVIGLITVACDTEAAEERTAPVARPEAKPGTTTPQTLPPTFRPVSPGDLGPNKIPGYRHTLLKSHARLTGPIEIETTADGARTRRIGKEGGFVELSNGFGGFALKAEYELELNSPYPLGSDGHNARVRQYFVDAGLPVDQIGRIDVSPFMTESGTMTSSQGDRQLLGHTTVLRRVVDGVPVAESFAWARINKSDVIVAEEVWWPDLPTSVRSDIAAFKSITSNPALMAEFRLKLPSDVRDREGSLVIHHVGPVGEKWYHAVTWDVAVNQSSRSYDSAGAEKRLVGWTGEVPAPSQTAK